MGSVLCLVALLVGLSVLIGYDIDSAKNGLCSKRKIWAGVLVGIALLVWAVAEWAISYRLLHEDDFYFLYLSQFERFTGFSSVKKLVLFLLKFVAGVIFNVFAVIAVFGRKERKCWGERIEKALRGALGEQLKGILPNDSPLYYVGERFGEHVIVFFENSQTVSISINSLGYEEFPEQYADFFCRWIQDQIVLNGDAYRLEKVWKEKFVGWEGGTSDYIETKRTSTGYESRYVSGSSGEAIKKLVISGYRLRHIEYIKSKEKPKLRKW